MSMEQHQHSRVIISIIINIIISILLLVVFFCFYKDQYIVDN